MATAKKNAAPTKSQIVATIADQTDLTKKQVVAVFDALNGVMKKALRGAGVFTLPGVCKMRVVKKPDDHQGQAGLEEGPRALAEEPERDGGLIDFRSNHRVTKRAAFAALFVGSCEL